MTDTQIKRDFLAMLRSKFSKAHPLFVGTVTMDEARNDPDLLELIEAGAIVEIELLGAATGMNRDTPAAYPDNRARIE